MRTLKKTLCLVLCLAMMAGLCVFASADFEDQDKIENEEAVAVLSGIGVINGDDQGNFNPKGTLTRAEATVIITKLLGAADIKATTDAFTDVAENYWGMPYIAYCVAEGVVAGMGDGTFAPNAKLTGYQWATLLLRAIGYEIAGETWQIDVAKLVKSLSLAKGMTFVGTEEISREDACQMALNALYAQTVHYEGGSKVTVGGVEIVTDSKLVKETYIDGTDVKAETLAHTYFPGLEKKTTSVAADKFGREGAIAYEYTAPGAKKAEVIYKAYTGADYSFVAENDIANADLTTKINKALGLTDDDQIKVVTATTIKANDDTATEIKAGDEVEIYLDSDKEDEIATIIIARYEIKQASVAKKAETTSPNKGKYKVTFKADGASDVSVFVDKDEYTDEAYYLVAAKGTEVLDTKDAETFVGTLTKYTNKGVYTISGETYESVYTTAVMRNYMGLEKLYILNNAGQIAQVENVPGKTETITDYVVVLNANVVEKKAEWPATSVTYTAQVQVLQSNGEVAIYDLPLTKATKAIDSTTIAAGDWYYKVGDTPVELDVSATTGSETLGSRLATALNGVYTYKTAEKTITLVEGLDAFGTASTVGKGVVSAEAADSTIAKGNVTRTIDSKTVIFNDKTVFILKSGDNYVVKTGVANLEASQLKTYTVVVDTNAKGVNVAKVVFAYTTSFATDDPTTNTDYIYVTGEYTTSENEKGETVYTYVAYKNDGTEIEVTSATADQTAGIYKYTAKNELGTAVVSDAANNTTVVLSKKVTLVSGTTYQIDSAYVTVNSSATVVEIDGELEEGATVSYVAKDSVVTLLFVTKAAE